MQHDQRSLNKMGSGEKLKKINIDSLPNYIKENKDKFKTWLEE